MKSRALFIYDYRQIDVSGFARKFTADEEAIQREITNVQNKASCWELGEEVFPGDVVLCTLHSSEERFQKEKIRIAVGSGLFQKEVEQELIGMKRGGQKEITAAGALIELVVLEVEHRVISPFDDNAVKALGIAGVHTVEEYRQYLIKGQKEKLLEEISYPAIEFVKKEMVSHCEILIKEEDWQQAVDMELSKLRVLSAQEGLTLEHMTAEEFEGKIPVKSYYELVALVQKENWNAMTEYAIGRSYARETGFAPSLQAYEQEMEEYAVYWHCTLKQAKEITPYEYYEFAQYRNQFYQRIRDYVRGKLLI